MKLPKLTVVDTNVPKIANLSSDPDKIPDGLIDCVSNCVEAIDLVVKNESLVLDEGDEIFEEYRRQLSLSGQPGIGDSFIRWIHDYRYKLPESSRVPLTKSGDSYREFPIHPDLCNFDPSDRKFIAVANAHPEKPPILQATDSKWWGLKNELEEVGIKVVFLCPNYVEIKYKQKFR